MTQRFDRNPSGNTRETRGTRPTFPRGELRRWHRTTHPGTVPGQRRSTRPAGWRAIHTRAGRCFAVIPPSHAKRRYRSSNDDFRSTSPNTQTTRCAPLGYCAEKPRKRELQLAMYQALKERIHSSIESRTSSSPTSRAINGFLICLIVCNILALVLETEPTIGKHYKNVFDSFEIVSVLIFSTEFLVRLWVCTVEGRYRHPILGRIKYILTPLALVDLLAILPFYLPILFPDLRFLRSFRILRLLRAFRLGRYQAVLGTFGRVLSAKREHLVITMFVLALLLVCVSSLMYFVERDVQPKAFSSIPAAMWWGVVTLTTIGYGDVYPVTPVGKVLGAISAILGIGMFSLPAGILASGFTEDIEEQSRPIQKCPNCGEELDAAYVECSAIRGGIAS